MSGHFETATNPNYASSDAMLREKLKTLIEETNVQGHRMTDQQR